MYKTYPKDYSKLLGKMKEKRVTQAELAEHIGIAVATLNLKLNNNSEFTQNEIAAIMEYLEQDFSLVHVYFYTRLE